MSADLRQSDNTDTTVSFTKFYLIWRSGLCFYHMLVVEQVHHSWCPFAHQHQVRRGLIEAQQTQGSWLFHTVHRITVVHHIHISSSQVKSQWTLVTVFKLCHSQQNISNEKRTHYSVCLFFHFTSSTLKSRKSDSPSHQDSRDLTSKSLSHFTASHICDTMKSQAHEGGVAAGQVILNGVVDQTDQLTVAVYQHWDEQVALEKQKKSCFFLTV